MKRSPIGWRDDVRTALFALGGSAELKAIYPKVYAVRMSRSARLGAYAAWTRNALQGNSRGRGKDIFVRIGRGHWALRS